MTRSSQRAGAEFRPKGDMDLIALRYTLLLTDDNISKKPLFLGSIAEEIQGSSPVTCTQKPRNDESDIRRPVSNVSGDGFRDRLMLQGVESNQHSAICMKILLWILSNAGE